MKIISVISWKNRKSLCFILMDVYQQSNDSYDHEFLLAKLKVRQNGKLKHSSSVLSETLSRRYFP